MTALSQCCMCLMMGKFVCIFPRVIHVLKRFSWLNATHPNMVECSLPLQEAFISFSSQAFTEGYAVEAGSFSISFNGNAFIITSRRLYFKSTRLV
jgi:hypothetical protein